MQDTILILRTRLKIANNYVPRFRDHFVIHLFVFLAVMTALVIGGTLFFFYIFSILERQEDFGSMLMNRLIGMVMMAFFSMLIFSNLIITLSTTYISREVEYLVAQPISHSTVFFVKMVEAIFYSSWAFAILSLPLFMSYGIVREVPLAFYPLVILLIVPYLVVPAGIGALGTMILSALLPARKAMKWSVLLTALIILASMIILKNSNLRGSLLGANIDNFSQILNGLKMGQVLWAPHYWMTQGMISLGEGDYKTFAYWLAMLTSTALMLVQINAWLAPRLFYRGWCKARESSSGKEGARTWGMKLFDQIESVLSILKRSTRALVVKDLKTFWRDPAQWSQLIILFGLLFIYMANLRSAYSQGNGLAKLIPAWQTVLSFFNMGATCFVLSILTTRFVYPMLSLEGKQFWVVGLAPIDRNKVVWQKYWLCWTTSLVLTQALMLFSNWILDAPIFMRVLGAITLFFMSFGLTSLAVGLGATTPNFKEDNPARIANGLGGTLNVIISLTYIATIIAIEFFPALLVISGKLNVYVHPVRLLILCGLGLILVHSLAIFAPMIIGLRRWRNIEF